MSIKQNLKSAMKKQGITLTALAKRSQVPKQTINDWLSGTSPRNLQDLLKVATALDLSIDALIRGNASNDSGEKDGWSHGIYEIKFRPIPSVTKKESDDE